MYNLCATIIVIEETITKLFKCDFLKMSNPPETKFLRKFNDEFANGEISIVRAFIGYFLVTDMTSDFASFLIPFVFLDPIL